MRYRKIVLIILLLALAQMACNLPTMAVDGTPGAGTPGAGTMPAVITATTGPAPTVEVTPGSVATVPAEDPTPGGQGQTCTYRVTFISDVTIPDNTTIPAGQSFVKTWRVRNDGTCIWGPTGRNLHSLAFTSGDPLDAPAEVRLPNDVRPGETVDISVTMRAPTEPGTYLSNWLFRVDGDPSGVSWVGIGPENNQPIYALIRVGTSSSSPNTSRVRFETGATSARVEGQVSAGERRPYAVTAMKDQLLLASISSPGDAVKVRITAADGAPLGSSASGGTIQASAVLPSTQDYLVWVEGGSSSTSFNLGITIPSRISFAPGQSSTTLSGQARGSELVTYVLRAAQGQTLSASLTGETGLTIYGYQDGQPLKRADVGENSYTGQLPATQDYIIVVVPRAASVGYTLTVSVN